MARYTASLEPLTLMLRVHPDGGGLGDPYEVFTVVQNRDGVAFLKGLSSDAGAAKLLSMMRACDDALRAAGFKRRVFVQVNPDGTETRRERDLRSQTGGSRAQG